MKFEEQNRVSRWVLIGASFFIVSLILWNTYVFFQRFKEEERAKMQIWAAAQAEFLQTTDLNKDLGDLTLEVLRTNKSTPMILVNVDGAIIPNNISEERATDTSYLQQKIKEFANENQPLQISYKNQPLGTLYYGNSEVLNKLKYYPVALILIILLFGTVIFFFYRTSKISEQNKLWAGMAKETAHQIGTPLSSLLGWVELLKAEGVPASVTLEIEKDIERLQTITDRFSKIGSLPVLETRNVAEETQKTFDYVKARTSGLVDFKFINNGDALFSELNPQLFSWTIENLIKNAIDAMKGKGTLTIEVAKEGNYARINVSDTGKGIPKSHQTKIFEPGFTTKKRGWGLGLSLVKRIIEDYHFGKVRVLSSEIGKGTTMQVLLKLKPNIP